MCEIKSAGIITPYDYDYKFFTSQAKSEYSVDIATEWAAFITENAGMVNPVIKDLNAAFYPEL